MTDLTEEALLSALDAARQTAFRYSSYLRKASDIEVADIVSEVTLILLTRNESEKPEIENWEAFATSTAEKVVLTRMRSIGRRETREEIYERNPAVTDAQPDALVAAKFEKTASVHDVVTAMEFARSTGDNVAIRVITVWLNIADETDSVPKRINVARRANVSPPTVDAALKRFKSYLGTSN